MKRVALLFILALSGCASIPLSHDQCNATKFPTAMEHEQCLRAATDYEQAQHENADRRLVKRDELIMFLNACDRHAALVLVEIRQGVRCLPNDRQKRIARKKYGYPYTHGNVCERAHLAHLKCMRPRDVLNRIYY